jgi:hypothetical protein
VIALSTVRVRYYEPVEDASWGGGTFALNAAVEAIERTSTGFRMRAQGTTQPGEIVLETDAAIAATGFRTPLRDLPDLGLATVGDGRIPALTPYWESTSLPGVYFAGNTTQGAAGLRKHGVGSASGTVSGFRYNARVLGRHLAQRLGSPPRLERVDGDRAAFLASEINCAPELWTQKGYLARALFADGTTDIVPLAHFLDNCARGSAAAVVEMNAEGEIYPVIYSRVREEIDEHVLPPHHLNDFTGEEYVRELRSAL